MLALPFDLLEVICHFLEHHDLLAFHLVCRDTAAAVGVQPRTVSVKSLRLCLRIAKALPAWSIRTVWRLGSRGGRYYARVAPHIGSVCVKGGGGRNRPTDLVNLQSLRFASELKFKQCPASVLAALCIDQSWQVRSLEIAGVDLDLRALGDLSGVHSARLRRGTFTNLGGALGGVHTLDLSECDDGVDVSALGGVHTLNLSYTDVVDVSMLGSVHTLNLSGTEVADVSALGGVHTLELHACERVVDVSALGRVHELDLSMTNVADVSALGGVATLNLSYCSSLVDVSSLGGVHKLILVSCDHVTDVSALGGVHTLFLESCERVVDVSALGGVHTLNLLDCPMVRDVSALGGCHKLNLEFTFITDVSALGGVKVLNLSQTAVEDVSALGGVEWLNLSSTKVKDVSALGRVRRLELRNLVACPAGLSALRGVQDLDLCHNRWFCTEHLRELAGPDCAIRKLSVRRPGPKLDWTPVESIPFIDVRDEPDSFYDLVDNSDDDSDDNDDLPALSADVSAAVVPASLLDALDDL